MGPYPAYHPPKGEECETSVQDGLPLQAEPAPKATAHGELALLPHGGAALWKH